MYNNRRKPIVNFTLQLESNSKQYQQNNKTRDVKDLDYNDYGNYAVSQTNKTKVKYLHVSLESVKLAIN